METGIEEMKIANEEYIVSKDKKDTKDKGTKVQRIKNSTNP